MFQSSEELVVEILAKQHLTKKNEMLFLSIPKPCHENWDEMSPREQGAFCNVCAKTVIDFTRLSDDQVKNYFFQHREQKTCGRFRNEQLTDAENPLPRLLTEPIPFWKKFLAIVFILFGSFLSGCQNRTQGKTVELVSITQGEPEPRYEYATIGKPEIIDTTQFVKPKLKECATTFIIPDVSVGDLEVIFVEEDIDKKIDTVGVVQPLLHRIDTMNRKVLDQNGCEFKKSDSTNVIIP